MERLQVVNITPSPATPKTGEISLGNAELGNSNVALIVVHPGSAMENSDLYANYSQRRSERVTQSLEQDMPLVIFLEARYLEDGRGENFINQTVGTEAATVFVVATAKDDPTPVAPYSLSQVVDVLKEKGIIKVILAGEQLGVENVLKEQGKIPNLSDASWDKKGYVLNNCVGQLAYELYELGLEIEISDATFPDILPIVK